MTENAERPSIVTDQSKAIVEWVVQTLDAATRLRVKTKPVKQFSLRSKERAALRTLTSLPKTVSSKLSKRESTYTISEIISLIQAIGEQLSVTGPERQLELLAISREMADLLYDEIMTTAKAKIRKSTKKTRSEDLYQFKVTLLGATPPIWRRFQTFDCTLDELHFLIQAAMGWTNSHLHEFQITEKRFGDPMQLEDDFDDLPFVDSTTTFLSHVLPASKKRFEFRYEYDFGDGWEHEVLFEGCPQPEKGTKYPRCIEGERACPPEDVGGVSGYAEFLEAIDDPKHESHQEFKQWAGNFDPDAFDPRAMPKHLRQIRGG